MGGVTTAVSTRRDAKRNRERLVASARELFAQEGIEVSVEEITHHAGVGMGTLYRHFPTKDELIDAVLEDAFAEILAVAERAAAAEDAWAGLTSFLEGVLELRFQNRGVRELIASGHRRARNAEIGKGSRPVIRRLIERAQAQRTLRPDFNLDDVSFVVQAVGRVIESDDGGRNAWRRHLDFLLDGLRTRL